MTDNATAQLTEPAVPRKKSTKWLPVAAAFIVGVMVGSFGSSTDGASDPTDSAAIESTPTVALEPTNQNPSPETTQPASTEKPQSIRGGGDGKSAPFNLAGGNYQVQWKTSRNCVYYANLNATTGGEEEIFSADSATSGTNYIYNISGGTYYISVITGPSCAWSALLKPAN